ncbi:MAG: ferritin-like domain-containing protein [Woeseiaceae bacterium]
MNIKSTSLFSLAEQCIQSCDPLEKIKLSFDVFEAWENKNNSQSLSLEHYAPILTFDEPGRPTKPELVLPRKLNRRKIGTKEGHAALIHSICHIEFNAINLAWDAVYRFQDMPEQFYSDWIKVAKEEAYHFQLLSTHLNSLGYEYGDFAAHNGLWESALITAFDPMVRMALVPRVLEARGLDVTPGIIKKLEGINDKRAIEILNIIHRDEIGHVKIGTYWFRYLCEQRDLDSEQVFKDLINKYMKGILRGPFDNDVRKQAGFTESELLFLESAN